MARGRGRAVLGLGLALAAAPAAASGDWYYEVDYTTAAGMHCTKHGNREDAIAVNYLDYPVTPTTVVSDYQCSKRCANGLQNIAGCGQGLCTAAGQLGDGSTVSTQVCPEADGLLSKAVCGSMEECKRVCEAVPFCYGFDWAVGGRTRCYLLAEPCQERLKTGTLHTQDGAYWSYMAKMDPERRGGELGCAEGISMVGADMKLSVLNDQYNRMTNKLFAENVTNASTPRVQWHHSGCGWVVALPRDQVSQAPTSVATCTAQSCANQEDAANWIFGQSGAQYDSQICNTTHAWLEEGYCSNALFRRMCPSTCGVPCNECTAWPQQDLPVAADIIAALLGVQDPDLTACANFRARNMCLDPGVELVCADTCAAVRRLRSSGAQRSAMLDRAKALYPGAVRRLLASISSEARSRRLGISGDYEEIYATWDDTDRTNTASHCRYGDPLNPQASDPSETAKQREPMFGLISPQKVGLYDLHAYNRPVEENGVRFTSEVVCPLVPVFVTRPNQFCDQNNIVVPTSSHPEVVANQCFKKCLNGPIANFGQSGPQYGYCDGNDPSFNQYSNALCLPREECERICKELPECAGIEMHKSLPRCYLQTAACLAPGLQYNETDQYNLLLKTERRQDWKTFFLKSCSSVTGTQVIGTLAANRDECEQACAADVACGGFDMHKIDAQCRLVSAATVCAETAMSYNTTTDWHFVRRESVAACYAHVAGHPNPAYNGQYARQSAGGQYKHTQLPSTVDIKWFPATTGVPCAGWYFRENNIAKYRSFANITDSANCPTYTVVDGGQPEPSKFENEALSLSSIYYMAPPLAPTASLSLICSKYPACPLLTTCVMARSRFASELAVMYKTTAGELADAKKQLIGSLAQRSAILVDSAFTPRVIVSVERTTAFIVRDKWTYTSAFFRNVPGALRMNLLQPAGTTATWDKLVITLASSTETPISFLGSVATQELGRSYPLPWGFQQWMTDVVRVEAFDTFLQPVASTTVAFEVFAPEVSRLQCFKFQPGAASTDAHLESSFEGHFTVTRSEGNEGYWRVSATVQGAADFVCTVESPCSSAPFSGHPNATVSTEQRMACAGAEAGEHCDFSCARGFAKAADWVCARGQWQAPATVGGQASDCVATPYDPELQYYRLTHRSRLDYGWKIAAVEAFTDEACTTAVPPADIKMADSSGHYTDHTQAYRIANVNSVDKYWWSKCLNCNPYSVDETHGAAAYLDFTVRSTADVRCVRVTSLSTVAENGRTVQREYYPTRLALYRGYVRDTNGNEQVDAGEVTVASTPIETHVAGWTKVWVAPEEEDGPSPWVPAATAGRVQASLVTRCGLRDRLVFGELMAAPYDYFDGVPSACHCQQLCIDHIGEGCVSWKYRYACPAGSYTGMQGCVTQRCFLQRTIKATSGGEWGRASCAGGDEYVGFYSGDTGLRLTEFEPAMVTPAQAFELTVKGVNLPTNPDLHLVTANRQRVKLVEEGEPCAESMPADAIRGIGCSSPLVCSPKPAETSSSEASWKNLKAFSLKETRRYRVCYNKGFTYDRYHWHALPGTLMVSASKFVWATAPAEVRRRTPTFNLTVTRPAFSSYSSASDWRIKFVKEAFDCSLLTDPKIEIQGQAGWDRAADAFGTSGDTATWLDNGVYGSAAEVGRYKVCFAESSAGPFAELAGGESGEELFLTIEKEEGDSEHPRGVYSHQKFSARTEHATNVTLRGFRLLKPTSSRIALVLGESADVCGNATFTHDIFAVDSTKSSAAGFYVAVDMPNTAAAGTYQVCYCDDQEDTSMAAGTESFKWTDNQAVAAASSVRLTSAELTGTSTRDWADDMCYAKCSRGCTGPACFCEAFDIDTMDGNGDAVDGAAPLCLDAEQCAAACRDITACVGFDLHKEKPLCVLTKTGQVAGDLQLDESWVHFEKLGGQACLEDADFTRPIGELYLTSRASIENDWVLNPGEQGSLELTGSGLSWFKDRIMIVDCEGTCGLSETTEALTLPTPGEASSWQTMWNHWVAVPDFYFALRGMDPPSDNDEQTPYYPAPAPPGPATYVTREERYCPGNNLRIADFDSVKSHGCYTKCTVNAPCVGADCHCDGHYFGYDGPDSNAVCGNRTLCEDLCTGLGEECYGIDMHRTKDRCFLNRRGEAQGCREYVLQSGLAPDTGYDFVYKVEANMRRMAAGKAAAPQRRLLQAEDQGYSWDQILRFRHVEFRSGGTFKVCFCDSALLATNVSVCATAADYKVEVGKVHVSGVYCLVKETRFQRHSCVSQWYGGLRCYTDTPPVLTPPAAPAQPPPASLIVPPAAAGSDALSTWCLYGPEEETRAAGCQWVA